MQISDFIEVVNQLCGFPPPVSFWLLKCHWMNRTDKERRKKMSPPNKQTKNSTWTNLLFVRLDHMNLFETQDHFRGSYRNESHKGTRVNHPIPDCIDFGTTCNDYINKPFLCNCICSRSWTQKPSQSGPKWIMPCRNKLIKLTQLGFSTNFFSRFKSLKI